MNSLSDNERAFAENYVISLRKDLAAISAGYSERSAKEIGHQVYNRVHVKAYIDDLLDQATTSAKETLKLISDTQRANMSNYMHEVERMDIPKIRRGLQEIIDHLQYEIDIEQEFLQVADGLTKQEIETSTMAVRSKELEIIRYDIELNKNPLAYRIVDGDPVLVKEIVLDLAALVADKERGVIKSYKVGKDGTVSVEICDPDSSKERMAKVHGLYEKDNGQKTTTFQIMSLDPLTQSTNADPTTDNGPS